MILRAFLSIWNKYSKKKNATMMQHKYNNVANN